MTSHESTASLYLETSVRSASPPKLRLMLIERAVSLCNAISQRWKAQKPTTGFDEQTLHLRDILTELLAGVGKSDLPVALQVADLYVFLCQHLTTAEMHCDVSMIDEIGLVLQTEAETWRMVCETARKPVAGPAVTSDKPRPTSLNLQG